jgi:Patatin-like phospholipase
MTEFQALRVCMVGEAMLNRRRNAARVGSCQTSDEGKVHDLQDDSVIMAVAALTPSGVLRPNVAARLRLVPFWAYAIIDALGRCWFLLVATLTVGFMLVFVPQGREALWAAGTTGHAQQIWMFFVTSLSGAVLVTLFASQILEPGLGLAGELSPVRGYACFAVPGLIGLFAAFLVPLLIEHLVAGNPYLLPERHQELQELGLLFQALALPTIVLARCPSVLASLLLPWRLERQQLVGVIGLVVIFVLGLGLSSYPFVAGTLVLFVGLAVLDGLWWRTGLEVAMRRWRRWAGLALAIGWVAAGCWVVARPESRAPIIGPATLVLFAEFFWIALAYIVFLVLGRWLTQGVTIALLIVVTMLFLTGPFNLRSVRTIAPAAGTRAASRHIALSEHIDNWLEARRGQIEAASDRYPVFIATAEGGGIRAACWTAGILCALQDANPDFADHLLGISSVSGGSLGAATFVALVREAQLGNLHRPKCDGSGAGPLQAYADQVLSRDFLSPVLATMLISDVGACLLHDERSEDRASALEKAFEMAWLQAVRTNAFAEPLNGLWVSAARDRVPALFLNSTEAHTGQRIVNSHVVLDPGFSSALCLSNCIEPHSLRVSTAVLLSARFPAISPIGSVGDDPKSDPVHIVDGGYADNSGTLTATEVVTALDRSAVRLGLRDRIRVVAIVISDDPVMMGSVKPDVSQRHQYGLEGTAAGALLSPFETLDVIREALSKRHREAFASLVRSSGGEVLDGFALRASRIEFPLGWMLSRPTRAALTQQIAMLKADPQSHFGRVRSLLSASGPVSR